MREYLIPVEDIPTFLNTRGIPVQKLASALHKHVFSVQSKETMDNFKDSVTPEQYAKTMARFEKSQHIVSPSFDRLYYAKILYAILRYGEKTVKGKGGKSLKELADSMKDTMTDINFGEPIRLTEKDLELLKDEIK